MEGVNETTVKEQCFPLHECAPIYFVLYFGNYYNIPVLTIVVRTSLALSLILSGLIFIESFIYHLRNFTDNQKKWMKRSARLSCIITPVLCLIWFVTYFLIIYGTKHYGRQAGPTLEYYIIFYGTIMFAMGIGVATFIVVLGEYYSRRRSHRHGDNIPIEYPCNDTAPIVYHPLNDDI